MAERRGAEREGGAERDAIESSDVAGCHWMSPDAIQMAVQRPL